MKPRIQHRNLIAQRDARDSSSEVVQKDQVAQQHRDYWEEQLDLLHSTLLSRHRSINVRSVREQRGVSLAWKTGHYSWGELTAFLIALMVVVLLIGLAPNLGPGFKLMFGAVSVAVLILVILLILMSKPKTNRLFIGPSDPVVDLILGALTVKEKGQDRKTIMNELARHSQIETESGVSLAQRLMAGIRRGA